MENKLIAKKTAIILLLILAVVPAKIQAQATNAGFVPGNIWYSKDPFEDGDKIKIYTLIFNPDLKELVGTVVFFDNSVFLGKKDFTALAKGVKDVSIDWTVTAGNHLIFGKIENSKFLLANGKYEEVYLLENKTQESSRTVSKKISLKTIDTNLNSILDNASSASLDSIKNIGQSIEEKIPDVISKPVILATNALETLRQDIGIASMKKKAEVKNQIKLLDSNNAKISSNSKQNTPMIEPSKLLKPFKYIELFALALFSTTFNNKLIFYCVLFLIIFFLLRYIWRSVF